MSFEIKPSTRQGIIPLFCLWGGTGGGKTESALRLARGIAGPKGRVGIIDTEGKRSGYYSDRIRGGFERIDFDAPYTPERYIEALDLLEKSVDVGVLDSGSHAWSGPDGVLDLHEQVLDRMTKNSTDWKERERLNWPAWREPKMRFAFLRNRILAFKIPLMVCFRGEAKTHMEKVDGKNIIITDKTTSPIFDKNFIFESHIAIEVFQRDGAGGFIRFPMPYAKTSHADMRALLPKPEVEQLTVEHGAALAAWCSAPKGPGTSTAKKSEDGKGPLLKQIRDLTVEQHGWVPELGASGWTVAKPKLQQWLADELGSEVLQHHARREAEAFAQPNEITRIGKAVRIDHGQRCRVRTREAYGSRRIRQRYEMR